MLVALEVSHLDPHFSENSVVHSTYNGQALKGPARPYHLVKNHGTQVTRWDFQNKRKSSWTGRSFFVLEVPR